MANLKLIISRFCPKRTCRAGVGWRRYYIWLILILALGIRLPNYDKSVEVDEMHSLDIGKPVGERLAYKRYTAGSWDAYETNIFIYKLSNKLTWFGSEAVVRLPYLLIGLLAIYWGWRLGRLWRFWYLAFWLALLLALWPMKVYWDGIIRHYTIMNMFWLLMVLMWERFRLRPTFVNFLVAMVVNVLTAWTHVVSVIVFILPFFYVLWCWLTGLIRFRRYRELLARPGWLAWRICFPLIQVVVLIACSVAVVTVNQGPAWTKRKLESIEVKLKGQPAAKATGANLPAKNDIATPDISQFFRAAWTNSGIGKQNFMPWAFLDPSWRAPYHMAKFFVGWGPMPKPDAAKRINWLLVVLMSIGGVYALVKSPPLFCGNWVITFATAMLLFFNATRHQNDIQPRYYFIAYSWILFQTTVGIALICRGIHYGLRRWIRRRILLPAMLTVSISASAVILWFLWEAIVVSNIFRLQPWKESFHWARSPGDDGVIMLGNAAFCYKYYDTLAWRRQQLLGKDIDWSSYGNDAVVDFITDIKMRDMAIVELFNPRRFYVASFFSVMVPNRVLLPRIQQIIAKLPFEHVELDGSSKHPANRIRLTEYDLENHVFVLQGKLGMPLLPRLKLPASAHRFGYELILHNEVPGTYTLRLDASQSDLRRVLVNDREIPFSIAKQTTRDEPFLDRAFHMLPTSTTLIKLQQPVQYEAAFPLHTELQDQTRLRIEFETKPTIEPILNLRVKSDSWLALSPWFSVSKPVVYSIAGRNVAGLILKAAPNYSLNQNYSFYIRKLPGNVMLQSRSFAAASNLLGRTPGKDDIFFIGPFELPTLPPGQSMEFVQNPGNRSLGQIELPRP